MARSTPPPNIDQLKKAIAIAEQIKALEEQLGTLLSGVSALPQEREKRKPGRPAKVQKPARDATRKKGGMSEEGRRRIAEAQRQRWAKAKGQ